MSVITEYEAKQLIKDAMLALSDYHNMVASKPDMADAKLEAQLEMTLLSLHQRYPHWYSQMMRKETHNEINKEQ